MKRSDLVKLRGTLLGVMALIGASGATWYFTEKWSDTAQLTLVQSRSERNQARAKLDRAREEKKELERDLAQYQLMVRRGVIGAEQRLEWVEAIRRIRDEQKLFEPEYEIAPQRPLDGPAAGTTAAGQPNEYLASRVHLRLPLLVEEDLIRFVDGLRASARELVFLRDCGLKRGASTNVANAVLLPSISADCTFEFVSVRPAAPVSAPGGPVPGTGGGT